MLAGDVAPFAAAASTITGECTGRGVRLVVSDAAEGYNPMHDLTEAVAAGLARSLGVPHLVFAVVGGAAGEVACELRLDGAARQRKRQAALAYTPLADEARALLAADDADWATERLRQPAFAWPDDWLPEYERIGRERVAAGRYGTAITYREHILPLARLLLPR
jgi:hypothetical protein